MLDNFQVDFILFAKIFLTQIISKINDQLDFDKEVIFECFSKILTLSYLESKDNEITPLSKTLKDLHYSGHRFLLEFKNNKNFEIDISKILKNINEFSLRDYQLEGIKWINFLFKYGLSGCLCDDMGLGKTIQSLLGVSLKYQ